MAALFALPVPDQPGKAARLRISLPTSSPRQRSSSELPSVIVYSLNQRWKDSTETDEDLEAARTDFARKLSGD